MSDTFNITPANWQGVNDLENALCYTIGMNLIGEEANVKYKIPPMKNGDSFTISRSDGTTFHSNFRINIYDKNGTQLDYYTILSGATYRTVKLSGLSANVEYIAMQSSPDVPLMVNYGDTILPYQKYTKNIYILSKEFDSVSNNAYVTAKASGINLIGSEALVMYPVNKLTNGDTITISKSDGVNFESNFRINMYDSNKVFIDNYTILAGTYYRKITLHDLEKDVNYIAFSTEPNAPLMANYGDVVMPYVPYISNVHSLDVRLSAVERQTGLGSFIINSGDSLLEGIITAKQQGYSKVIVEEGEYDIISEYKALYGNDYFENYQANYDPQGPAGLNARGIWLENISILFSQGAKVICHYEGDNNVMNENVQIYFSAFATGNNVEIDGLVADSSEVRYTIHPDFENGDGLSTFVMKNCDMHNLRTVGSDGNRAFGAGLGKHSNWLIEDCIFRADGENAIFSIHNNAFSVASSKCVIKNCYFDGDGYLDLHPSYSSGNTTLITVSGCCWKTDPAITQNAGYQVLLWGNTKRS